MNGQTPVEFDFSGSENRNGKNVSFGHGWGTVSNSNPVQRIYSWSIYSGGPASGITEYASGRISVNSHWPLACQTERFDYTKVKVGQQLKFKSWPAPLPG